MAYATSDQVGEEFKDIVFSSTTSVTDTDVDRFIDEMESLINETISNRYLVPVDETVSPISVLTLRMISIWLVKSRILSILSVKTPQDKTKQDPDGPTLYDRAMDLLKQISKGTLQLTDATLATTDGGLSSFLMNECVEYPFHRDSKDW